MSYHKACALTTMDYLSFIFFFILVTCVSVNAVIVTVDEGQLNGDYMNLSTGLGTYYSFRGIPYAEPPVGKLRFKDPLPHKSWEGVRNATEHGPKCIQYSTNLNEYVCGSEDCLFLNVYTTELEPSTPLPVMFFIHGGAFFFGSGDEPTYGPDFIIPKGVVLVTINYRLDALGFLRLDTKDVPGNAGLKDQALALKWVHRNIHHFGGNPQEVTIMGQSAGSASVIYHMTSPMTKGLFKRAIALSGVPMSEWAITYKLTNRSFELGRLLGNDTRDPDIMLDFLQSLPALEVIHQFPVLIPEEIYWYRAYKMTAFQPAPEKDLGHERFLVEPTVETLKRGNVTPVDLLIGYTSMEFLALLPVVLTSDILDNYNTRRELLIPREIVLYGDDQVDTQLLTEKIHEHYFGNRDINLLTVDRYTEYASDMVFVYNVNRFINHLPREVKKYLYKFFIVTERNRFNPFGIPFGVTGVAHADDLVYLFDSTTAGGVYPVDVTSRTFQKIDQIVTLFTNFAKYGNPTPDDSLGVIWPEYDNESKGYMAINETLATGNDVDADVNHFWHDIYEEGGVELP